MNELTQKNAELGRFLFCERYTLQPVKNSLFIAEGQDLKRGAVVDVNGVLVGTNSLMPYAVLENDCDTRTRGAFASVFVKGEFNFDKLFFADGLSKEDLDNIVYNGSGIGLVIKPYDYEKGFSPKQQEQMEQVEKQGNINRIILSQIYNPLNLPPNTIRCKFKSGYTPAMGTSQTLVDNGNNVWDIGFDSAVYLFRENYDLLEVIGANTSGITDMTGMFYGCEVKSVALFDTSSAVYMAVMFEWCTELKSVPLFDTSSATNMNNMFNSCTALEYVPLFDTSSATDMNNMFEDCEVVKSGALAIYQQASAQATPQLNHNNTFKNCGKNTVTGAAELAQIPASWGGTAAG